MSDDLHQLLSEWFENEQIKREKLLEKYPPDVPNSKCLHAFIKGINIENSFKPSVGDFLPLFETENEKIFVWTYEKDTYSALISKVEPEIKTKPFWKTVGSLINLSQAYAEAFEGIDFESRLEYYWIYYFSEHNPFSDLVFYNLTEMDYPFIHNGRIIKATDLSCLAPEIELLNRDDKCYTAISLLFSSFQIHYCCLICELGLSPIRKHESHEPELWEQADFITKMESAIVQACRCAESILGEPPNTSKQNRILAHKQRWIELVGIDPDSKYERAETSYWDFYIELFDTLRNPSAHSYGNIHFDLERKRTIDAQCFAALLLRGYIDKHAKPYEEALDALRFNRELLCLVDDSMSTKMTKQR
jgi:hypothetical protein